MRPAVRSDANRAMDFLKPLDVQTWFERPVREPRWLVPDLIPRGSVTMISGDGGLGKSLLSLQLLVSLTIGGKWLGVPVNRCKSAGIFCEDDQDEIHRRMSRILKHEESDFDRMEGCQIMSRVGMENALVEYDRESRTPTTTMLFNHLMSYATDEGLEVLVLDSLHDLYPLNENSRPEARYFINQLRSIAMEMSGGEGGAVILNAHPSVAGMASGSGTSGSTAWSAAVRSRLYLTKMDGDEDGRVLKTMKANYSRAGSEIRMLWEDGVFVPQRGTTWLDKRGEEMLADEAFLKALKAHQFAGGHVSPKRSPSYAPTTFSKMEACKGIGTKALEMAMYRLLEIGTLRIVEKGPPSARRERLVFTESAAP